MIIRLHYRTRVLVAQKYYHEALRDPGAPKWHSITILPKLERGPTHTQKHFHQKTESKEFVMDWRVKQKADTLIWVLTNQNTRLERGSTWKDNFLKSTCYEFQVSLWKESKVGRDAPKLCTYVQGVITTTTLYSSKLNFLPCTVEATPAVDSWRDQY